MTKHKSFMVMCVIAAILCGCAPRDDSPLIARVGKRILTLNQLDASVPQQYRDQVTHEQHIAYVKQWIDNELLYQEALRKGIKRESAIRERLDRMERDLLCAEMMSRITGGSGETHLSEEQIQNYYETNKTAFVRNEDAVRFSMIVLPDPQVAKTVREKLTPANFVELGQGVSVVPVQDAQFAEFVSVHELEPALAQCLRQSAVGTIGGPVAIASGYALVKVLAKESSGTAISLAEVRDEIASRLTALDQKNSLDQILASLRTSTRTEFHFERIPGK